MSSKSSNLEVYFRRPTSVRSRYPNFKMRFGDPSFTFARHCLLACLRGWSTCLVSPCTVVALSSLLARLVHLPRLTLYSNFHPAAACSFSLVAPSKVDCSTKFFCHCITLCLAKLCYSLRPLGSPVLRFRPAVRLPCFRASVLACLRASLGGPAPTPAALSLSLGRPPLRPGAGLPRSRVA